MAVISESWKLLQLGPGKREGRWQKQGEQRPLGYCHWLLGLGLHSLLDHHPTGPGTSRFLQGCIQNLP